MSNSVGRRFTDLIEPHLDTLFRAAFRLTRNQGDAEDLVQETCARAFQCVPELDESRHVKGWLLRVLHNVFVDNTRRARRSPVTTLEEGTDCAASSPCSDPNPEESTYTAQREEQLEGAWAKLERGQRALLALRAEGYWLSEITEITGLTTTVLNARLYRARQSFARLLRDEQTNAPENRKEITK